MKKLRITIGNKSYDVTVEDLTEAEPYHAAPAPVRPTWAPSAPPQAPQDVAPAPSHGPPEAGTVTSPMAGTIKSVLVKPSDQVTQGQPMVVLEAMKMENQITAPVAGTVKRVDVKEGDSVREGHVLLVLE